MTTQITLPPTAPSRGDRNTFADRADAWITWQQDHLVPEINALALEVNENTLLAQSGADAAAVALATANFKGAWSTLTGPLTIPASVYHLGTYWVLLSNVSDVTTKVPGTATEWVVANTVNALPWFVASGSVTKGAAVAINADGTVSTPAVTAASAGTPASITTSSYGAICYASTPDKFVLASNVGSSNVQARVGTLSGTTVSWGATSATIGTLGAANKFGICYAGADKVVVVYAPASGVYAAVGTISGTTISFGTSVQIAATASSYVDSGSVVYDPDTDRVVVAYQNGTGNTFAIAGQVSGTSITFGSAVDVGASGQNVQVCAMPGLGGKVFIAGTITSYRCRVLSLSGSVITAGSEYVWQTPGTATIPPRIAFDPVRKTVLIAGCGTSGNVGVACVATITATEISFGSSRIFAASGVTTAQGNMTAYWDTTIGQAVILFGDLGNSGYYTMVSGSTVTGVFVSLSKSVFYSVAMAQVAVAHSAVAKKAAVVHSSTDYYTVITPYSTTVRDYIGIAQATVTTGQYLQVAATQYVDAGQTGLTTGSKYYLTDAGALTTTYGDYFAGTAVGATKLLVKG